MNYTPSNLATAQAKLLAMFEASELRYRTPATFLAFISGSPIMLPDYKILRTRDDRAIDAFYKKRTARALGSARSHNHTGTKGDSAKLTPSFLTYDDKFTISLKQGDNNVFDLDEQLTNEYKNVIANFAEGLETAAVSHLFNNRTGVNGAAVEGSFNAGNKVYEIVDASVGNRAVQITSSVMDVLKYNWALMVFCDSIAFNKFRFLAAQGAQNATNYSFQFMNTTFIHSPELTADAATLGYTKGYWEAVPEGTISALNWIPKQNREGKQTTVNLYSSLLNPVDGLDYAVHSYETRADGTATNGQKQDVTTEFQVSIDVALEHAPLSVANETTIIAFALT